MSEQALAPHEQTAFQNIMDRIEFFGPSELEDGLTEIAFMLKRAPDRFPFSAEDFKLIAQSQDPDELGKDHLDLDLDLVATIFQQFEWFDAFLPRLNMWVNIAESILRSRDYGAFKPDPNFAEQRSELIRLLTDVLNAYPSAVLDGPGYGDQESFPINGSRELLKRYWTYTRYICAFAKQRWPLARMDKLLQQT